MIALRDIATRAGAFALEGITFEVPTGCYAVLMGRTGSGKTSLLEIVCGLRKPTRGSVILDGQEVTRTAPGSRNVGYLPQDGALFPTMTVEQHLAFPLRLRHRPAGEIAARIDELAHRLSIPHLLQRRPEGLSGGERQRVALGRALSFRPTILLLDEPLSALDEEMRGEMRHLLKRVQTEEKLTALHVTHDRTDAEVLGDLQLRLEQGKVTVDKS